VIILDTNVLSELMRSRPEECVIRWLTRQTATDLYVTTITCAEILFGIDVLPNGKRKSDLQTQAEAMFSEDFAGQVLNFDLAAASAFAAISVKRQPSGRALSAVDAMIAAIATIHGAAIATRDSDFLDRGIPIITPWETGIVNRL
jgi:predicted nucleic acid-binding protein